jgi:hypothetical protein
MRTILGCCVAMALCVFSGCGPSGPELAPATGVVKYKGAPLEGASVSFWAEKAANAASGVTDAEGKFTLTTNGEPGAPLGKGQISISKKTGGQIKMTAEEMKTKMQSKGPSFMTDMYKEAKDEVKSLIPERYANYSSSGLTAEVKKGAANDLGTFELTD